MSHVLHCGAMLEEMDEERPVQDCWYWLFLPLLLQCSSVQISQWGVTVPALLWGRTGIYGNVYSMAL